MNIHMLFYSNLVFSHHLSIYCILHYFMLFHFVYLFLNLYIICSHWLCLNIVNMYYYEIWMNPYKHMFYFLVYSLLIYYNLYIIQMHIINSQLVKCNKYTMFHSIHNYEYTSICHANRIKIFYLCRIMCILWNLCIYNILIWLDHKIYMLFVMLQIQFWIDIDKYY